MSTRSILGSDIQRGRPIEQQELDDAARIIATILEVPLERRLDAVATALHVMIRCNFDPRQEPTVPRGHGGRCDRCGWNIGDKEDKGCRTGSCAHRPLPERRTHCACCGARYTDA